MKNSYTQKIFGYIVLAVLCIGCSKTSILKPGCLSGAWILNVEKELNAWSAASTAYGEDPSKANCENYKNTGQAYLNALDKTKKCIPGTSLSDYNKSIEDAKKELSEIVCE